MHISDGSAPAKPSFFTGKCVGKGAPYRFKSAAGTKYNVLLQVGQDVVTLGGITAESWATPTEDYEDILETE